MSTDMIGVVSYVFGLTNDFLNIGIHPCQSGQVHSAFGSRRAGQGVSHRLPPITQRRTEGLGAWQGRARWDWGWSKKITHWICLVSRYSTDCFTWMLRTALPGGFKRTLPKVVWNTANVGLLIAIFEVPYCRILSLLAKIFSFAIFQSRFFRSDIFGCIATFYHCKNFSAKKISILLYSALTYIQH